MKTVLFVCGHNAGRSQMAEAFLARLATEQNLSISAISGGTTPGPRINPTAELVMQEVGVPLSGQHPKLLTQEMADQSDRVITMGCGVDVESCPARFLVTEDWGLDDPSGQPVEKVRGIRDQIRARVEELIREIEASV